MRLWAKIRIFWCHILGKVSKCSLSNLTPHLTNPVLGTPSQKEHKTPENQWLEDLISYWNNPFLGDMQFFRGILNVAGSSTQGCCLGRESGTTGQPWATKMEERFWGFNEQQQDILHIHTYIYIIYYITYIYIRFLLILLFIPSGQNRRHWYQKVDYSY